MAAPKILIVDDEIIIARELEARLKNFGYDICGIAASGKAAVRLTEEMQPDLVLMDIVLKGDMDGVEAAAEIRQRWSLPIIYLTAYTDETTLRRARATEPFSYIVKPFSERELRANIEMALYKHKVENRRRKVERWFTDSMQRLAEGVLATDRHGVVTFLNRGAQALTGWGSEAVGCGLDAILALSSKASRTPILDLLPRVRDEALVTLLDDDTVLTTRSGTALPVDVTATCVRDEQGDFAGVVVVVRDLSERSQVEEALRQSEQRFAQFMQHLPGLAWIKDAQGHYVYVNEAAARAFRLAASEVHGKTDDQLFPPDTAAQFKTHDAQVLAGGTAMLVLETLRHEDGILHSSIVSKFPIPGPKEDVPLVGGVAFDITDLIQVEEALRESEGRLRLFIDHAPAAIAVFDRNMRYLAVSRRWLADYNLGDRDLIGQSHYEVFPDVPERWRAIHQRGLSGEVVTAPEDPFERADGTVQWLRWEVRPWRRGDGAVGGIIILAEDITARKRAEDALRASESRFRQLADAMSQLAWMARADGHIYWYNRRWYEYTGTTLAQMEGWGWQAVHDATQLPKVLERWQASIATGQPFDMVFPLRGADGRFRPFLTRVMPLRGEEGRILHWFGTNTDISDQKQAEEEVRRLNAELEERVRDRTAELEAANQELEAFSYSVSHDLRAPLRAIDGFSRIVLQLHAAPLSAEGRELLQLVRDNTRQMGQLVDDLLTFARLGRQPITKQTVELAPLVKQCLEALRGERAGRQVEIVVGELPACRAEPSLLKQVWVNLIANALKYTRQRAAARVEIGAGNGNARGGPIFYVKDNGVGFDMRYAHKLFGVFQRLHRAEDYEGTGVGLAIVQRIVHRHGGRVWAEAQPNQGATFYFTLG